MHYNVNMPLTLIIGPMKSGKSLELISAVTPHEISGKDLLLIQPHKNERDNEISSRAGLQKPARKVHRLSDITDDFSVIGVDEVHMFQAADIDWLKKQVHAKKEIIVSGLDIDYSGKLFDVIRLILQLQPDKVIRKQSVCELCNNMRGAYTQILHEGRVIKSGLPPVIPEDGSYQYRTVCRDCYFV